MATDPDALPGPAPPTRRGRRDLRRCRRTLLAIAELLTTDRASMAAAGAAFYATLALFLAISTLISLYGLAFDRASVAPQLRFLEGLLPTPAYALIAGWVEAHVAALVHPAGLGMLVGFVAASVAVLYRVGPARGEARAGSDGRAWRWPRRCGWRRPAR